MSRVLLMLRAWLIPLAYASPVVGVSCLMAPIAIVQGIYAKYYAIPLTTIAAVVLLARLFDAITDPTIGYWSDRYYQKTGNRKPFVLVGGLLVVVSGYFLYVPPEQVSTLYFVICLMLFYLTYTLFDIPHITWGGEIASRVESAGAGAVDKTKIYSLRVAAGYLGLVLFYSIPQLSMFDSSEITPETLRVVALVAGLLSLVLLLVCMNSTPRCSRNQSFPVDVDSKIDKGSSGCNQVTKISRKDVALNSSVTSKNEWRLLLQVFLGNKPFMFFCTAVLLSGIGSGMWYGLIFIYVDSYLGLGSQFAQMFMLSFIAGVFCAPLSYRVALAIGKKNLWILATLLTGACFIYTSQLQPGDTHFYELVLLKMLQTIAFSAAGVVVPSLLSEITDYGRWKYHSDRSATCFAVYTFITKSSLAIAMALGLAVAGWYGFDAAASTHSESSVFGLALAMTWIPLFFSALSLLFIFSIPLTERQYRIVCRRLSRRGPDLSTGLAN